MDLLYPPRQVRTHSANGRVSASHVQRATQTATYAASTALTVVCVQWQAQGNFASQEIYWIIFARLICWLSSTKPSLLSKMVAPVLCCYHRLDPSVQDLQRHIESDVEIQRLFEKAFSEIPDEILQGTGSSAAAHVGDYRSLMKAIDQAIKTVPHWASADETQCIVGCPINEAMVVWSFILVWD